MGNSIRPTIVAGLATRLVEVAARLGVEREFILAEGHLDPSALEERDNRVPVEAFARMWHALAARCPDRVLALDWVASWRITDAGVMGYVLQQLGTLGEAMEAVGRYGALVNQAATPRTEIAKLMGLSERTLQRRLSAEGTTFNGVLEDARREIALGFLADKKLAAYEVSFLLGYSEPATFFRAFKRWTGKTPQQYRASAMHA
jgi:AraC-like DNA-binding protein